MQQLSLSIENVNHVKCILEHEHCNGMHLTHYMKYLATNCPAATEDSTDGMQFTFFYTIWKKTVHF